MNTPLAICAPNLGAVSETFIQRHMKDLLPNKVVIVANSNKKPYCGHWTVDAPSLVINNIEVTGLKLGLKNYLGRKLFKQSNQESINLAIENFLKHHQVKVILGEYLNYAFSYFEIAQKLKIPYFAHAHGADVSIYLRQEKWRKKYKQYQQATGIITMNQISRKRLIDLGIEEHKIHVIPYGVDTPNEPIKRQKNELIRCLAVGRMVGKKAPILLLESFRRATKNYPNLQLDYVGTGDLLPAVKQFIHAFQLEDKVILHGKQPNEFVLQLMKKADIFLQHSIVDPDSGDEEGLPVAILEAMGYCLPVISTRHAGIPESVLEGETGLLVDEGNVEEMAQNILELAQDFDLRQQMGLAGWQRVKECFSWEKERKQLLEVMQLA
ncbi:glycosyltransferase family 4 protein [Cyanothece sp. BG0011]|uniref:glycosyltransferase family 4 protein n=1 Tax=Cyanothece sp. BG0011 TaxID=2082950 RepID=UPI000D1F257D|nr:glycosyltransferase family 4 protein [Cyanothece sp. BG0011]